MLLGQDRLIVPDASINSVTSPRVSAYPVGPVIAPYTRDTESLVVETASNSADVPPPELRTSSSRLPAAGLYQNGGLNGITMSKGVGLPMSRPLMVNAPL